MLKTSFDLIKYHGYGKYSYVEKFQGNALEIMSHDVCLEINRLKKLIISLETVLGYLNHTVKFLFVLVKSFFR